MSGLAVIERGSDELVERVGERSLVLDDFAQSFETLYRDRYRDVYRYALLMLHRAEDAEDVTAEAFQRAYRAWRSGHGPSGHPLPWLLLITRRLVIDRARRRRLVAWLPLGWLGPNDEPAAEGDEARTEFWLWFDRFARELPPRQREVLILRYQRDLTDEEVGEVLGLSASGVRSLASRACATLRAKPEIWQ